MASSENKATTKSDPTPPGDCEETLDFDDDTLRAIAEVYLNEGNEEHRKKNFSSAIHFYTEGIKVNCKDEELNAKLYSNRATANYRLGNYSDSLSDATRATELQPSFVKAIVIGANACVKLNLFEGAITWCEKGLAIEKENATLLKLKNMSLKTKSTSADKIENRLQTKAVNEKQSLSFSKQLEDKVAAYGTVGNYYHSLGDYKTAFKYCQQSLFIAKQVGNKDLEGTACLNLGNVYHSFGELKTAHKYYQEALSIAKQVHNSSSEGRAYGNLGLVYFCLGDLKAAIEYHQMSLSIAKQIGNKDLEENAYGNLGLAYTSLGDFKTAIEYHQQHLSIAKEIGNKISEGKAYLNLGAAYSSLRDFETAIEYHQEALSIAKQIGNKESEGKAYGNLGGSYHSLGDFESAIKYHQQDLAIAKHLGDKDTEGKAHINLGHAYCSLGDFETAIKYLLEGLSIAKQVGNKESQSNALTNLGRAYCSSGDLCKGEEFYKSSVRLIDETRALLQMNDEWKISLRNEYDGLYLQLWLVQLEQNKTEEALSTAERGRAQALMDLMESRYGVKSAQPESDEHISSISKSLTVMTVFLAEASNSVNFWVLQKGQPCQFLQKQIGDDLVSLTDKAYKKIGVFKKVMCENRSLDELADEEFEEVPERNTNDKELASADGEGDALKVLSEVVINPISHLIQGNEVIIVPDASLFLVPYAALVDQHSRYLSETIKMRLVPTLTSLKLMAECPKEYHKTSGALLVGDPWVESVRINKKKVKQLPAAKQEVEMIGTIVNIAPLIGKNATKAEVLSRLNSVALIHIAAHGRSETGEIVLSPNPTASKRPKEEDFLLTMADVFKVNLRARVVVLSCCHSGRGKIKAEGVVGLARAFLGTGARSVIASLWAIDDKATLEFMRHFYEHLKEGQSAGEALNQAMKQMRESDNFNEVKHWAPFVLIGDDVTLDFGQLSGVPDV